MVAALIITIIVEAIAVLLFICLFLKSNGLLAKYKRIMPAGEKEGGNGSFVETAHKQLSEQQDELRRRQESLNIANKEVGALRKQLTKEQDRSAKLLLNVLPPHIVEELKTSGKSEPESFESVTVFFSDIVDFTRKTSFMDTNEVIAQLNMIFTEFDRIFKNHKCERIKTIGDSYLAVSGMGRDPDPRYNHNMLNAAQEAMEFVRKLEEENPYHWQMRMGIHTGRVVGGIVGSDKYIYDVFGDTINVASRMEQASKPMRINVSETTYALTKDSFVFTARGQIETKGKGLVNMYFLEDNSSNRGMTEVITHW